MSAANNLEIVPFGKYKGKPIEILLADGAYIEWLKLQPDIVKFLMSRHRDLYDVILGVRIGEADCTPAHNALQMRFLDEGFCDAYISVFEGRLPGNNLVRFAEEPKAIFETRGFDVLLTPVYHRYSIAAEVKPQLGDDFPAVLRQVDRQRKYNKPANGHIIFCTVLVDRFNATQDFQSVYRYFLNSNIMLIPLFDVEGRSLDHLVAVVRHVPAELVLGTGAEDRVVHAVVTNEAATVLACLPLDESSLVPHRDEQKLVEHLSPDGVEPTTLHGALNVGGVGSARLWAEGLEKLDERQTEVGLPNVLEPLSGETFIVWLVEGNQIRLVLFDKSGGLRHWYLSCGFHFTTASF